MLVGYARVSTTDQSLDLQQDALRATGCTKVFTDVISGAAGARPGLAQALEYLRPGDTLVVWRLDRLGRSLSHLIEIITTLTRREVGFRSLQEHLDTTTSGGKLIFHVFGALAEFEREIIRERTQAGLAAARARGRRGGRPRKLDDQRLSFARALLSDPTATVTAICQTLQVSRSTLYRRLRAAPAARRGPSARPAHPAEAPDAGRLSL
jgi:DNA invertase Pin-like site-specific DNA recombinase